MRVGRSQAALPDINWDNSLGPYSFLPVPVMRESNSELVWRMWDDAVVAWDTGSQSPRDLGIFDINYD